MQIEFVFKMMLIPAYWSRSIAPCWRNLFSNDGGDGGGVISKPTDSREKNYEIVYLWIKNDEL